MGQMYTISATYSATVDRVLLDSVAGVEAFEAKVLAIPSVVVSMAASAVALVGAAVLTLAIFGSCPTVYADTGTGPVLEAEGFSYAGSANR